MGAQLRAPMKSLGLSQHYRIEGLTGGPQFVPHHAARFYSIGVEFLPIWDWMNKSYSVWRLWLWSIPAFQTSRSLLFPGEFTRGKLLGILLNQKEIDLDFILIWIDLDPNGRPFGSKSIEKW